VVVVEWNPFSLGRVVHSGRKLCGRGGMESISTIPLISAILTFPIIQPARKTLG
jgi:hypothetical protein